MGRLSAVLGAAAIMGGIGLTGCAKLTDAEFTWCANHEAQVRQAAAGSGTEGDIDWPMQGPPDQYDDTYADACRQALEAAPSTR
jgi:hypothetical protein